MVCGFIRCSISIFLSIFLLKFAQNSFSRIRPGRHRADWKRKKPLKIKRIPQPYRITG